MMLVHITLEFAEMECLVVASIGLRVELVGVGDQNRSPKLTIQNHIVPTAWIFNFFRVSLSRDLRFGFQVA